MAASLRRHVVHKLATPGGQVSAKRRCNPSTAKNVVYHRAWTEANYNDSSLKKYKEFVNENIAAHGGVNQWSWAFNVACLLESQLFDIGLEAPDHPYEIVPNGTYSIHTSSANNLVLAVQDVTPFLRPPAAQVLGGYLPSNTTLSIVGNEKTGGDNEKWLISATKTGYTFQNTGTGLYLGMSTAPDRAQYRILEAVSDPYCWWVNPSSEQQDQGPSAYQYVVLIHDSSNLQYTLHAAIEALDSIVSGTDLPFTPVTAHKNSDAPCEMWSFDDYRFKQPKRTQTDPDDHKPTGQGSAELSERLREADATINQLEAERAVYTRENSLLREELKEVGLTLGVDESRASSELPQAIRKLLNTHSSEMRNLQEVIAVRDEELAETAKVLGEKDAHLKSLGRYETEKRANICYWEDFRPILGSGFDSASFDPPPIEIGKRQDRPTFIVQYKSSGHTHRRLISDGWPSRTDDFQFNEEYHQVLVGDPSRLSWIPLVNTFKQDDKPTNKPPEIASSYKRLGYKPVTGWDIGVHEYNTPPWFIFIGRYNHKGGVHLADVVFGRPGRWGRDEDIPRPFEVLCYNP
ncbi:hypothetical protein B0H16DRAFT_1465012 [Mycena metata]|uniref:Uncharacterized protein n=1 Tax=Mycena metata TaxID=1033252 RepID=A0AAD7N0F2_9AGAR|nr:hypothetical protein B0H16DRAFT_1465012 [Mycena metata]